MTRTTRACVQLLTRIAGSHVSEDLAQTVFAKAAKALPGFRGDAQSSTWLYRIAAHVASDWLRSRSAQEAKVTVQLPEAEFGEASVTECKPRSRRRSSVAGTRACPQGNGRLHPQGDRATCGGLSGGPHSRRPWRAHGRRSRRDAGHKRCKCPCEVTPRSGSTAKDHRSTLRLLSPGAGLRTVLGFLLRFLEGRRAKAIGTKPRA